MEKKYQYVHQANCASAALSSNIINRIVLAICILFPFFESSSASSMTDQETAVIKPADFPKVPPVEMSVFHEALPTVWGEYCIELDIGLY